MDIQEFIAEFGEVLFKAASPPAAANSNRQFNLLVSTDDVDYKGHQVVPSGLRLDNYRRNPVFMWNHAGYDDPANIIGKTLSIEADDHQIKALVQYGTTLLAENVYQLELKGLLPANSIGIRPTRVEKDGNVYRIVEYQLTDVSKVAVGMNPHAVS